MDEVQGQQGLCLLYEIDPDLIDKASLPQYPDRFDNNHDLDEEWQKVALY